MGNDVILSMMTNCFLSSLLPPIPLSVVLCQILVYGFMYAIHDGGPGNIIGNVRAVTVRVLWFESTPGFAFICRLIPDVQ